VSWSFWLAAAIVVSCLFALTGLRAAGARPVGRTKLMAVARIVLLISVAVLFYLTLRARSGR
jgi:hypothetical protein